MQIITLGIAPPEEDTVQVVKGRDYMPAMKAQAKRFLAALEKRWPDIGAGCRFKIQTNPHDFGNYLDVVIEYPDGVSQSKLAFVVALADAIGEIKTWDELEKED